MSNSSKNIREKNIENQEKEKPSKRGSYKKDYIKEEIYKKLNEGTILHFIRNSKKSLEKTNFSKNDKEMKYDLSMINKYEESNSNLSFISDFDYKDKNDSSFNSDENLTEEIDRIKKLN